MQAEEIMEKKIASAMEVCKKYNRIKADGKKAEAVWKYNLDMAADAKYPKETEMYEEYADKALTGFKASIKWLKIVDRAMRMVLPYEAEQVLTQHFVEGNRSNLFVEDGTGICPERRQQSIRKSESKNWLTIFLLLRPT